MKRVWNTFLALALAVCLTGSVFSGAALYTFEDGKLPESWEEEQIQSAEDVTATELLAPLNPKASAEARNLQGYLSSLTDSPQFLTGQFDINTSGDVYKQLQQEFGLEPALYSVRYTVDASDPVFAVDEQGQETCQVINSSLSFDTAPNRNVDTVNGLLLEHYENGNVLLVHADSAIYTVCGKLAASRGLADADTYADGVIQLDRTNPDRDMQCYALFMLYQQRLLDALGRLEQSGVRAYLFRPWIEFNYNEFCGVSDEGKAAFVRVWQQTVQMFLDSNLTGYLLTYSPGCTVDTITRYPGNGYVDVLAATIYSDPDKLGALNGDYFKQYDWYCRTGKPMGFTEISCRQGNAKKAPLQARGSWYSLLKDMVQNWSAISFANCWGAHNYSLVDGAGGALGNDDGALFLDNPFTLELTEIPDYRRTATPAPGVAQLYTSGKTGYQGLEQRRYTAAALQELSLDLTRLQAVRLNTGWGITFYTGADCTGESYHYSASVDSVPAATAAKFRSCAVEPLPNVALNQQEVYASVNDGDAWKVTDGMSSTWQARMDAEDNTAPAGTAWIYVDLGKTCSVSQYVLKTAGYVDQPVGYNLREFTLQVSSDGETWRDCDRVTDNTLSKISRTIPAAEGRYFRLWITGANSASAASDRDLMVLAEWELYGLYAGHESATPAGDPAADGEAEYDPEETGEIEESNTSGEEDSSPEDDTTSGRRKVVRKTVQSYFPWWGWLLIAVGVVAVAVAVIILVLIQRKKRAAATP